MRTSVRLPSSPSSPVWRRARFAWATVTGVDEFSLFFQAQSTNLLRASTSRGPTMGPCGTGWTTTTASVSRPAGPVPGLLAPPGVGHAHRCRGLSVPRPPGVPTACRRRAWRGVTRHGCPSMSSQLSPLSSVCWRPSRASPGGAPGLSRGSGWSPTSHPLPVPGDPGVRLRDCPHTPQRSLLHCCLGWPASARKAAPFVWVSSVGTRAALWVGPPGRVPAALLSLRLLCRVLRGGGRARNLASVSP